MLIGASLLTVVLTATWFDASGSEGASDTAGRPAYALATLGLVATLGALWELLGMGGCRGPRRMGWMLFGVAWVVVVGAAGLRVGGEPLPALGAALAAPWSHPRTAVPAWLVVCSLLAGLLLLLRMRRGPGEHVVTLVRQPLFCVAYAVGLATLLVPLLAGHIAAVVSLVVVSKASDIGGYFAGKTLGRHKLAPVVSPNKTWEGLVGGVLLSAVVAAFVLPGVELTLPLHDGPRTLPDGALLGALLGAALALVAALSDLAESLVKRSLGVKDSGTLFGESGGFFDVTDSLLLMGPLALVGMALL